MMAFVMVVSQQTFIFESGVQDYVMAIAMHCTVQIECCLGCFSIEDLSVACC